MAAYLTEVRVVFVFRRSAMICAPSTFNWLAPKLQTRTEAECQRLLTVGNRACGGVHERLERRVRLEGLCQVLGTVLADPIGLKAANKSQTEVSAAADTFS